MYSFEIGYYVSEDAYLMEYFNGIYDFNISLPRYIKYPSSYIINVGNHWVAIFIDKFRKAIYFDSMGFPPPTRIHRFLNSVSTSWRFNMERIQSEVSTFCGHYCLLILKHLSQEGDVDEFINTFKNTSESEKDYIIYNMFIKCYGLSKIRRIEYIVKQRRHLEINKNNRVLWR